MTDIPKEATSAEGSAQQPGSLPGGVFLELTLSGGEAFTVAWSAIARTAESAMTVVELAGLGLGPVGIAATPLYGAGSAYLEGGGRVPDDCFPFALSCAMRRACAG